MGCLMKALSFAVAVAVSFALAAPALAETVQITSGTRGATISSFDPIGQSFTAVDSDLTAFGFQFQSLNPGSANNPITFTLREGEGLTGAVLATRVFTLPATINSRVPVFFDIDITGTRVTIGQRFTALLTTEGSRNAITFGPDLNLSTGAPLTGDAYAGGRLVFAADPDANGFCTRNSICDANFRVMGTRLASAVPEPGTWATMIGGFGLVGAALRRRRPSRPALA